MWARTVCHINARSILKPGRLDEMYLELCSLHHFGIIGVTETHLSNDIPDTDVSIPNYISFRRDRNRFGGGVVMLYVNECFSCHRRPDLESQHLEMVWVEIKTRGFTLLVGVCYRPPNQNADEIDSFLDSLDNTLSSIPIKAKQSVVLMGDFNDRCKVWDSEHSESELGRRLVNLVQSLNLSQLVNSPTRNNNLLDLLITDSPGFFSNVDVLPPIDDLDHNTIYGHLNLHHPKVQSFMRKIWLYDRGDYQTLNAMLFRVDWDRFFSSTDDLDALTSRLTDMLLDCVNSCVPTKHVKVRARDKPGMTQEIRGLFKVAKRLHRKAKRTGSPMHAEQFRNARRDAKTAFRKSQSNYFHDLAEKLTDPSTCNKTYWKLNKLVYGSKSSYKIADLKDGDEIISDPAAKATLFNTFFAQQCTLASGSENDPLPEFHLLTDATLDSMSTTPTEIHKILRTLNISKASGPDGVSNRILKECAGSLCSPLARLFNMSFQKGQFPNSWKLANVVPIYKKDDRQSVNNYRPVSLLCTMSKVLERVVHSRLYSYCKTNNLLTDKNSGFKDSDSTVNQLLFITHKITQALDNREDASLVFLDISKAFDKVWHRGLLFKLRQLGLSDIILDWFSSYLDSRVQQVVVDGETSQSANIFAGVPQGSILGPLLFLIYINDLVENLLCNVFLYADDTFLLDIFSDPVSSSIRINTDLNTMLNWGTIWKMIFSPPKTSYMIVSKKTHHIQYPDLTFNGSVLQRKNSHKHLGLVINKNFTWNEHIENQIVKAKKRIHCINNIKHLLPRRSLCSLYNSMVLPVLEYCDIIYDNCTLRNSLDLENVQRRAALVCTGAYRHTSNDALLAELGWQPLRLRRQSHKLLMFYKVFNSLTPPYLRAIIPRVPVLHHRLRSTTNAVLPIPFSRLSSTRSAFVHSTVKLWNNLSIEIRSLDSLSAFKRRLKIELYKHHNVKFLPQLYSCMPMRRASVHICRLRLGLSALNFHRFTYNFIPDKSCPNCNSYCEDTAHVLFHCPAYAAPRAVLWESLSFLPRDLTNNLAALEQCLLFGSHDLSLHTNMAIFSILSSFVEATGRFSS